MLEVRRRDAAPASSRTSRFTLHAGEVLGLIGLLGAGRTELALALFGMTRLDGGEILARRRAGAHSARTRTPIAAGIAYVSEDRLSLGINLRQSIADNIAITVLDRLRDRLGLVAPERRHALAAALDRAAATSSAASVGAAGADPLGRQPAARRARQMARDRRRRC